MMKHFLYSVVSKYRGIFWGGGLSYVSQIRFVPQRQTSSDTFGFERFTLQLLTRIIGYLPSFLYQVPLLVQAELQPHRSGFVLRRYGEE